MTTDRPRWGDAPWAIPIDIPAAPLPERCDVAVLGAGFTGLSTAYHLARRGVRVVVLEAAGIGAGASGRTGGLVLEGTAAGPLEQVEHCLQAIAGTVGETHIDCDLVLSGCWTVRHVSTDGMGPPGWRDGGRWIVRRGSEPGGTVDPGKLVAGLARAAQAAGADIHERAPAQRITATGAAYRVGSAAGELVAGQVVVALNAYTTQLLDLPQIFRSALTLALCTAPVDAATLEAIAMSDGVPFYTHDLPYLWGRHVPGGRLVFGAGLIFPHDRDVRSVDLARPVAADAMSHLEARVRSLHAALADVDVTHRWGGPIAFLPGGAPILSRVPGAPGVITHAGCAGHGVALGVRIGQLVAAAIVDGERLPAWGSFRDP
jgi:glycine/D-amino acid oxidase-like deaminating enzyme